MRKIGILSVATLSLVLFAQDSFAARDLSLSDTVELIMQESQDVKKSDANLRKAQAGLKAANANRWFTIEGSATYMNMVDVERPFRSGGMNISLPPSVGAMLENIAGHSLNLPTDSLKFDMPDNVLMMGATITQPIYTFGKIGNAVDGMRRAIKVSESSLDLTRREVRYAAADMYWTAKMTDSMVDIYQKSYNDAVAAKKKLTSAGRANRSNLVKIESDILSKEINLSDAKFNRDTAYRMLKILSGIDVDEEITLTDNMPTKFEALNVDGKLKSNPEWDIYEQQIKMYEANAKSKRAGNYPTLAATASYNYMAMHTDVNVFDGSKNQTAYWGLALQVPIFDGGLNRASATVEAMNAEAAYQDLDKSKKMKTEEYNTAVKKHEHLRSNLANLKNARDLAEKAYNISQNRFGSGQTSAVELAEVSNALSQLDMALLNAKYNILMSAESVKKLGQ